MLSIVQPRERQAHSRARGNHGITSPTLDIRTVGTLMAFAYSCLGVRARFLSHRRKALRYPYLKTASNSGRSDGQSRKGPGQGDGGQSGGSGAMFAGEALYRMV